MFNIPKDLLEGAGDTENLPLDINLIKSKIPSHSSTKLCEMIVCDRYFGFSQEIAILCMEELSRRRTDGDKFNFEDYIESALNKLPVINVGSILDIRSVFNQSLNLKK